MNSKTEAYFARRRSTLLIFGTGFLLVSVFAFSIPSLAETPRTEITEKLRAIAATGRHQMDLPDKKTEEPIRETEERSGFWSTLDKFFGYYATLVRIMFWIFLAIAVAFMATPVGRSLLERFASAMGASTEDDALSPSSGLADDGLAITGDPVTQARALAEAGRTSDAIFVLLLAAVRLLRQRASVSQKATMTNRELLSQINRGSPLGQAFADLVRAAELVRFAGRVPQSVEVEQACQSYSAFQSSLTAHG